MHFSTILGPCILLINRLATGNPLEPSGPIIIRDTEASSDFEASLNSTFDPEQMHSAVLANLSPDQITTLDNLELYIESHSGSDIFVYLSDAKSFVSLSAKDQELQVAKRQPQCSYTTTHRITGTATYWEPWLPSSPCYNNERGSGPLVYNMGWAFRRAVTLSAGISFDLINPIMIGTFGASITKEWERSESLSCEVPAQSRGQVWGRHAVQFASFKKQVCQISSNCAKICWDEAGDFWAVYPRNEVNSQELGCSSGENSIWCDPWYQFQ